MEKISTILIDDEKGSRELLSKLLSQYVNTIEIVGEAGSVDEAYEVIEKTKPQLIFLDIQMPRANGFSLLKKYSEVPFEVIFVTSFDQYAITAIRVNALDYLLKPVEIPDLQAAVEKARGKIKNKINSSEQMVNLLLSFDPNENHKRIAVHSGEKVKLLNADEIVYIKADGRYCHIHLASEHHTIARALKDFEDYFGNNSPFVRISKSYLLNIRHIKTYSKGEPVMIELTNGKTFEIPRRKKAEILEKLKN